jgi:Uma2 family endonuclease
LFCILVGLGGKADLDPPYWWGSVAKPTSTHPTRSPMIVLPVANPKPSTKPCPIRWTREEYHLLGDLGLFNGRTVELINGEIFEMSPKGWPHVVACRKTAEILERVFAGIGWVARQEPLVTIDSEPEPDVSVLPGRFEDYTDHPTTALLVVEIADTSFDHDTTTKAELYATAGIPDYWVLDLINSRLLVFRDPAPIAAGGTAYRTHLALGSTDPIIPIHAPSRSICVCDLLP